MRSNLHRIRPTWAMGCAALISACATNTVAPPRAQHGSLHKIAHASLCVTEGEVMDKGGGQMEVDSPAMRAVVAGSDPEVAEIRFVYEGPTSQTSRLGNGEVRRQVALKLRAEDSCNVVYVVWRFDPESKVVVQTKHNPGKHAHKECGDHGYENVQPRSVKEVPPPAPGEEHLLQALLTGDDLQVLLDQQIVWEGDLESKAPFSGPVGIRTDNARIAFEMAAVSAGQTDCGRYGNVGN